MTIHLELTEKQAMRILGEVHNGCVLLRSVIAQFSPPVDLRQEAERNAEEGEEIEALIVDALAKAIGPVA